jgi:hypothetical protein
MCVGHYLQSHRDSACQLLLDMGLEPFFELVQGFPPMRYLVLLGLLHLSKCQARTRILEDRIPSWIALAYAS